VDLLASAVAASAAVYSFAGVFFAFAYLRRKSDAEHGILALMCLALAESAAGTFLGLRDGGSARAVLLGEQVSWVGLIAAFAMIVHFGLRYLGVRASMRTLGPLYGAGAVLELLDARGLLHDVSRLGQHRVWLRGVEVEHYGTPLSGAGIAAYALGGVAVAAVLVIVARAYLAGRRDALAIVIGTTALLATVINDLGVALGAFSTTYLVNAGFVVFIVAASTTFTSRHAAVYAELERRTKELRTRTRELRRSYEELRAAQEELVRKEQLAVVGELAAVIAHEVRNPLAIIANAVAGLRKSTISRDDHETLLSILDEETSRLNRLVTDLLRYARPVNLQRQHIPIAELLERTLNLTKQRKPVGVELKVDAHDARIWGDGNLLRQVFDNLVDNAVQAMGAEGTLTVCLRPTTDEGVDGVAVDIIDTGEGMDTQVRSRARDPFFTTRPSGTGLGLAIVDRIVDAHGGRFLIDSRAGEGTTVTVFLPYGSSSEPPPKPRSTKSISDRSAAADRTSKPEHPPKTESQR
jgi:signal transduction histidine kinase